MNSPKTPCEIALANLLKPLPASPAEERQDLLDKLREPKPITVEHHEQVRREMLGGLMRERDFDDIDLDVNPPFEPHQRRKEADVNRLFRILDSLETQNRRPRD